jgi:outer membrane protein assembly factor BamE (lipoprotein component of BamABCDE complex)
MRRADSRNKSISHCHWLRAGGNGTRGAIPAVLAASLLAACSSVGEVNRHGHHFTDGEIAQVRAGMSRDAVRAQLGTPDTTSTINGGEAYYYIASTTKTVAFMKPTETDRKVLAVYFNPIGSVDRVANYGLKDGKVVNLISRETPSHASEQGLLKQLFRNLGYKQIFGD